MKNKKGFTLIELNSNTCNYRINCSTNSTKYDKSSKEKCS